MKVGDVFTILALTCVWVLLREEFSGAVIVSGLIFSSAAHFFCCWALPTKKVNDVQLSKLATYPLYIIGQVYMAGFSVVKLIFTGADVEIVHVDTELKNESLIAILVDSITLVPGSILVKLDGKGFLALWIKPKGKEFSIQEQNMSIKGDLEKRLLKAQK